MVLRTSGRLVFIIGYEFLRILQCTPCTMVIHMSSQKEKLLVYLKSLNQVGKSELTTWKKLLR